MKKVLAIVLTLVLFFSVVPTSLFSISVSAETNEVYSITYHLDGGTNALKNPDVYTEDDVITLMGATKVGYDFVGWFLDENMTEQIDKISNATGNIELYAKFAPQSYIGIFDDNGATSSSSIRINLNNSLGQTKEISLNNGDTFDPYTYWTPSRNGYVFLGWYNNSKLVSGPLEISQDLSLIAKWSKCEQTDNDGILGGGLSSITVRPDVNNDKLSTIAYVYISASITTVHYEGESRERDIYYLNQYKTTIRGNFTIYDVTHQITLVNGSTGGYGEKSGDLTVAPGTLLKITATSGYAAVNLGYYAIAECSLTVGGRRSSNIAVSNQRSIGQEFDSTISTPNVKKTGYDLLGWYDIDGNKMSESWRYTENQTFTAKWKPTKYNILYNLDGGKNHASNPAKYTIEDAITLKNPTKPGYTFKGWYSDANFKTQVASISNQTENITLYAKWEVNSYNLILDANTGVFAPKVTFISDGVEIKSCYLYGQDIITAYRPTNKDGYIFAGWYSNSACTSLFKFNGTIANDITLYAKWAKCNSNIVNIESVGKLNTTIQGKTEQLYAFVPLVDGKITVTSKSNNLDLYGRLYDASKNVLISADDISSTDLDFTYNYNVEAGQLYYISAKGNTVSTAGQTVINIGWTGNCTITGTTYQNRQFTIAYDTDYKLPQKPVREGYVFQGWFDKNDTQITDGIWNFVTDKTLTAKWEEATYHTVVFKDLAGNIISSETYYLSEDIVAPELPKKAPDETYIYHAKWDNDYTGVCTGDAAYSPVFDAEYIEYTVIFADEDGAELSRRNYHWGDEVTPPTTPTKTADSTYTYAFAGWDKEIVDCAGNATYTATYMPSHIDYTVVFKDWDGTILSTNTYHYGDSVTIPVTPTKTADSTYTYAFAGWDHKVVNCAGNTTYIATYTPIYIEYTVVFKNWNEDVLSTKTYHYGDEVVVPQTPTKGKDEYYDYIFVGWDKDVQQCSGDIEYKAIFAAEHYHTYKTSVIAPTCNDEGYTQHTCACGDTYNDEYVNRLEHTYDNACDADCNVCSDVRIPSTHKIINYTFSNATNYPFALSNGVYSSTNKVHSTKSTATITFVNNGSIKISYYTSTESNYDKLTIKYNSTTEATVSGSTSWASLTIQGVAGDKIYISYSKDGSVSDGNDTVYFRIDGEVDANTVDATCEGAVICNICDAVVKPELGHSYSNACDAYCDRCDQQRVVPDHVYTNTCDTTCNECGETRIIEHAYANSCDAVCDVCGETRVITHTYDNACDTDCNVCGALRTVGEHVYTNTCDTTCDICGDPRSITHTYDNACDADCNVCGEPRTVGEHVYTNDCDTTCNECGDTRSITHTYDNACDTDCNVCGETRTVGDHVYTNDADTTCDHCGAVAYPGGNILFKENGVWYHVVNRQKVTDTTLVKYNGIWHYVQDGVLNKSNTLVKYSGKWYHVNGGKWVKDTTLVKYKGVWCYVQGGVQSKANTLVKYNGKWYHVNGGKWVKDTTLVKYNGVWCYVQGGVQSKANTLVKYSGKWYHVNGGKWVKDTTLVKYNGVWHYVQGGLLNKSNTLVKYSGKWYHVNGGKWVKDTTLVKYNGVWHYVQGGLLNKSNTLVKYSGKWYHVNGGKWVKDTTLVKYSGKWYFVKKGVVDFTYTGKVKYNGKTYTVKKGIKV